MTVDRNTHGATPTDNTDTTQASSTLLIVQVWKRHRRVAEVLWRPMTWCGTRIAQPPSSPPAHQPTARGTHTTRGLLGSLARENRVSPLKEWPASVGPRWGPRALGDTRIVLIPRLVSSHFFHLVLAFILFPAGWRLSCFHCSTSN